MTWGDFVTCTRGYRERLREQQSIVAWQTGLILSSLSGKSITGEKLMGGVN